MFEKLKKDFCEPFNTISQQPYHFVLWLIFAVGFGLLSLWITLFSGFLYDKSIICVFGEYLNSKNLATFSIVILAEGIAGGLLAINAEKSSTARPLRAIAGTLSILVLIFISFVVFVSSSSDPTSKINLIQLFLALLAILLAIYMYCFRNPEWQKSVDIHRTQEEDNVTDLNEAAAEVTHDKSGVQF